MNQNTKSANLPPILLLIFLLFGCQTDAANDGGLPGTATSGSGLGVTATINPIATTSPPQPSATSQLPTLTSQPTNTPQPTATPTTAPIDWAAIRSGATVLYYKDQDLWRSNIEGGQQQALTEGDLLAFWELESVEDKWWTGGFNPRPFVSPNGRFIAFTQTGRNMVIVDVADPASPRTLSSGSILMAWSPDSRYLAYSGRHTLHLYDTVTNRAEVIAAVSSRGPGSITWSSDGRYIGFVCCFTPPEEEYEGIEYGHLRQYDMETGRTDTIGEATSSIGGGAALLCWQDAGYFAPFLETGQSSHCTPPGSSVFYTSFSPDGNLFAHMLFSPEEDPLHFHLLTVENNQTGETLWEIELAEAANQLAWSPDGRFLLLNHYYPGLSPIWRLPADGTSTPELIIEEAYLMGVVPMWQESQ